MAIGEIPHFVCKFLEPSDMKDISEAISKAESRTSAEIVPMIVKSSSVLGTTPYMVGLSLFSLGLLFDHIFDLELVLEVGGYFVLILLFLSVLAGVFLSRLAVIQRAFSLPGARALAVHLRAELEFHRLNMTATKGRTGVLLFISMAERQVVVLGDLAIDKKLGKETWDGFIEEFLVRMKRSDLKGGLLGFIEKCGGILAQEFPVAAHDNNEISNDLVIKE